MHYIANKELGRKEAAKKSILKALDLAPNNEALIYNYSINLAQEESIQDALEFLEKYIDRKNTDIYEKRRGRRNKVLKRRIRPI